MTRLVIGRRGHALSSAPVGLTDWRLVEYRDPVTGRRLIVRVFVVSEQDTQSCKRFDSNQCRAVARVAAERISVRRKQDPIATDRDGRHWQFEFGVDRDNRYSQPTQHRYFRAGGGDAMIGLIPVEGDSRSPRRRTSLRFRTKR